jgi:hypothetical protein
MHNIHRAVLTCGHCGADAVHEITYAGRLLAATRCTRCCHTIRAAIARDYLRDLKHRIGTKPIRMLRRARRDPVRYACSLPRSVATKPIKLLEELRSVLDADAGDPRNRARDCDTART